MLFKYIIDKTIRKEFKKKGNSFITYKKGVNELLQVVQSNITTEDEKDDIIMKNKLEFILGLIGGILGILFSSFAIFIGFISDLGPIMDSTTGEIPTNTTMILGSISLIASILGIIGSILIKTKRTLGSLIMIISAIVGFLCISIVYILPGVFFLVSSLMIIFRKNKTST
ncbi:DUF4064 domain-containing protein [Bacillus cereus group sp. MYBK32-1]|uniref:DUF4064 domain-containing protein n=1 Tax=Bacillus cereus group sp. MYBK32-1 TaxID=3450632 RepID=UPI002A27B018|nr:DUF4064 domain-containing protein [Bacillus cereus]